MMLTATELVLIVALAVILASTIAWMITTHYYDKTSQRINDLSHYLTTSNSIHTRKIRDLRAHTGTNPTTRLNTDDTSSEDALAVWETIINTERRRGDRA